MTIEKFYEGLVVLMPIVLCICLCILLIFSIRDRIISNKLQITLAELEKMRIEKSGKIDGIMYCPHCGQKCTIIQKKEQESI